MFVFKVALCATDVCLCNKYLISMCFSSTNCLVKYLRAFFNLYPLLLNLIFFIHNCLVLKLRELTIRVKWSIYLLVKWHYIITFQKYWNASVFPYQTKHTNKYINWIFKFMHYKCSKNIALFEMTNIKTKAWLQAHF